MSSSMREAQAAVLRSLNPTLRRPSEHRSSLVAAAQNMRMELAAAFPGVKFSVRSSRFSGGDSITVKWVDGPCSAQVDEIVGKYEAGTFSGMDDSYTYSRSPWPLAFGSAKYLMTSREHSPAAVEAAIRRVWVKYGDELDEAGLERPSVTDYVLGRVYGRGARVIGNEDLCSLIGRELARHTKFAKPVRVIASWPDMTAQPEETAA